ncbi:MAG: DUF4097 family beta strand repeat-containing protein [Planctomycetota bacterium]
MFRNVALLSLCALTPACVISVGSDVRVDGVDLEEKHSESLSLAGLEAQGLVVDASFGDVTIEPTSGPSHAVGVVYEVEPGDAYLAYVDGRVESRSHSGEPTALGHLHIFVHGPLPSLDASTGAGSIELREIDVLGDCTVSTGSGDVRIADTSSSGTIRCSTGLGDVVLRGVGAGELHLESGMGDVSLHHVEADKAELGAGMGDIELHRSAFDHLDADTGMGDIDVRDTSYRAGGLDTGFGSVHR